MRFWTREAAGWLLIVLGLFAFYRAYELLTDEAHRFFEGAMLSVVGIFIFRGGIHLLKVAVAARVCLQAEEALEKHEAGSGRIAPRSGTFQRPFTEVTRRPASDPARWT